MGSGRLARSSRRVASPPAAPPRSPPAPPRAATAGARHVEPAEPERWPPLAVEPISEGEEPERAGPESVGSRRNSRGGEEGARTYPGSSGTLRTDRSRAFRAPPAPDPGPPSLHQLATRQRPPSYEPPQAAGRPFTSPCEWMYSSAVRASTGKYKMSSDGAGGGTTHRVSRLRRPGPAPRRSRGARAGRAPGAGTRASPRQCEIYASRCLDASERRSTRLRRGGR